MSITVTTLRNAARELVTEEAHEAAKKAHARNHHKLHVRRDGTLNWFESINQSDDIIDDGADHFCAVRSVITVGTGSCACNCDHCDAVYSPEAEQDAKERGDAYDRDSKYETAEEAILGAAGENASYLEDDMLREFDAIPAGYFDDEE